MKKKNRVLLDGGQENVPDSTCYEVDEFDLANGVISIHSTIKGDLWEDIIRPLKRMEHDPDIDCVTVYLNSEGGETEMAMVFCDIIDTFSKPLNLILFGEVWSAGMIMSCSGSLNPNVTTYCLPSTLGVFHRPFLQGYDEQLGHETLGNLTDVLTRKSDMIREYVLTHTKIQPEEYDSKVTDKDWYLSAQELVDYGIVDEIITGDAYVFF